VSSPLYEWSDEKRSEYILNLLKQKGAIQYADNVINCQKAFLINSILQLCFKKSKNSQRLHKDWIHYLSIIDSYIKNETNIIWRDGKFEIYQ